MQNDVLLAEDVLRQSAAQNADLPAAKAISPMAAPTAAIPLISMIDRFSHLLNQMKDL